jgi:hypothetical protein
VRTTFEIKHSGVRTGIVIEAGDMSAHVARVVARNAYEYAACKPTGNVTDPGFWAICVGAACLEAGPASVQRVVARGDRNVVFWVERGRMLEVRPEWPMVQLAPTSPVLDLRGRLALRRGPSDAALLAYRETLAMREGAPSVDDLHRMFEQGVLEWGEDPKPGKRREVVRARI